MLFHYRTSDRRATEVKVSPADQNRIRVVTMDDEGYTEIVMQKR